MEKRTPVKYTVLERSLIGNEIHEVGAVVDYDGLPADNLAPTCDEGRARAAEYERSNAERVAKMKDQYADSSLGDPQKLFEAFRKELAASQAVMVDTIAAAIAKALAPKGKAKPAEDPIA